MLHTVKVDATEISVVEASADYHSFHQGLLAAIANADLFSSGTKTSNGSADGGPARHLQDRASSAVSPRCASPAIMSRYPGLCASRASHRAGIASSRTGSLWTHPGRTPPTVPHRYRKTRWQAAQPALGTSPRTHQARALRTNGPSSRFPSRRLRIRASSCRRRSSESDTT
jgi:hypothetical protein